MAIKAESEAVLCRGLNNGKDKSGEPNLDSTASNTGGVVELGTKPKQAGGPIHHDPFELCTRGAGRPLSIEDKRLKVMRTK